MKPPPRRTGPEDRLLVARELGKANRAITAIRSFYLANAILSGVALAVVALATPTSVVTFVIGAIFLLAVTGISQVRKEPFVWTLGLAAVWTFVVVGSVVSGNARGYAFFLSCAWALGCWMMLPSTRRVRELLRAHPDLWIARRMAGRASRR